MSPAAWRAVALLGVCATLIAGSLAPESTVAQQLSYFLILFVLIIPLHELGHAVAGALVGFRIISIVVGSGPPLASFRWLGVHVRINLLPLGGMTMGFARREHGWVRLRQWIFTAGGPAANVLIYVVLRSLYGAETSDSEHHPIVATAAVVNWSILVGNLIPFRMAEGLKSDGYSLFTIPFWSPKQIEEAVATYAGLRVDDALNRDDVATARRLADEMLVRFPGLTMPYSALGSLEHRERRHDAAVEIWRAGLEKAVEPRVTALFKNNIAFAQVVRGHPEDLPEADRFSAEAIAGLPEIPAVAGTRGAVLLRLGRAAEALPLLTLAENGATDRRNLAYNKALMAGVLAAVGRGDQARRKLAEARALEPDCELIPLAEAHIAAGPIPAAPAPVRPGTGPADPAADAVALRRWRRDARILAFVVCLVVLERLGLSLSATVIGIVLWIAPELSGAVALAAYGLSAALMHALGRMPPDLLGRPPGSDAALLALAMGAAACWLVARHRRLVAPPPSRTPIVLGWILAGMVILSLFRDLISLSWDGSPLARYGAARGHLSGVPGLIALAALLVSRRRRPLRLLAAAPVALALLALAGGSSWYLNRVALADVPVSGVQIAWIGPTPAKPLRQVVLTGPGHDPAVSPGGRAYMERVVSTAPADGGAPNFRALLRVGDFEGRTVEVPGSAGAFIDDERVLVLRRGDNRNSPDHLVAVRPLASPEPIWSKVLAGKIIGDVTIRIERATGTVFIQVDSRDGEPIVFRTSVDPGTGIVAHPLRHLSSDRSLAIALPVEGWGGQLISRASGLRRELWWRGPDAEHRIGVRLGALDCVEAAPGTPSIWCTSSHVPLLLRFDAEPPRVVRVPGEFSLSREGTMLSPTVLALLIADELAVVDLNRRFAMRLTLPDRGKSAHDDLLDGALATVTRTDGKAHGTLTVYESPLPTGVDLQTAGR